MAGEGMVVMKPSSVTVSNGSASITTKGAVAMSGASVVSLNGCFSSTYDNYMILFRNTVTDTGMSFRYLSGGVSASASLYAHAANQVNGTNTPTWSYAGSQAQGYFADTPNIGAVTHHYFGPAVAKPTSNIAYGMRNGGGAFTLIQNVAGYHSASVSYDGIQVYSSSNLTGQIAVYGLEK